MRWRPVGAAAAVLFLVSIAGCRCGSPFVEGESECSDGLCVCVGTPAEGSCAADCGGGGCSTECRNAQDCRLDCGDGCTHQCLDMNFCEMFCGADCDLGCARMESCTTDCGAGCEQLCEHASICAFTVGADSEVTCRHVGACEVTCSGSLPRHLRGNRYLPGDVRRWWGGAGMPGRHPRLRSELHLSGLPPRNPE